MKQSPIFILLLAGFLSGFLVHGQFCTPNPKTAIQTDVKTEVVHDTLTVEKIVYKNIPAKVSDEIISVTSEEIDSLASEEKDIQLIVPEKASVDTVIDEYGKLWIDYFFYPRGELLTLKDKLNLTRGEFDIAFDPFPKQIIKETQTVTMSVPFYKSQKVGFLAGVFAAAVTVYLVK